MTEQRLQPRSLDPSLVSAFSKFPTSHLYLDVSQLFVVQHVQKNSSSSPSLALYQWTCFIYWLHEYLPHLLLAFKSETWISFPRLSSLVRHQVLSLSSLDYLYSLSLPHYPCCRTGPHLTDLCIRFTNGLPACSVTLSNAPSPWLPHVFLKCQSGTPCFHLKMFQWPVHIC